MFRWIIRLKLSLGKKKIHASCLVCEYIYIYIYSFSLVWVNLAFKMNIYRIIPRKVNKEWKKMSSFGIKSLSWIWVKKDYLISSIELSTTIRIPPLSMNSDAYIENNHKWIDCIIILSFPGTVLLVAYSLMRISFLPKYQHFW